MDVRKTIVTLVIHAGLALPAIGQNALGDGRGLERSFQRTGVTTSPRLDLAAEVRMRNAAVTGNATSGQSLRIGRPYLDQDEFRASLGSDSLFRFRRDSYASGLGVGFRGTEALQYQYAFGTGNSRGFLTRQNDEIPRTGTPNAAAPRTTTYSTSVFDRENAASTGSAQLGALRSTSAFASTRALSPAVVGFQQNREGGYERVTASGLLGVRNEAMDVDPLTGRLVERTPVTLIDLTAKGSTPLTQPEGTRPEFSQDLSAARTAYDDIMGRLRARPEPEDGKPIFEPTVKPTVKPTPEAKPSVPPLPTTTPGAETPKEPLTTLPPWEARLQRLREQLLGREDPARRAANLDPDDKDARARLAMAGMDDEILKAIRDAGGKVEAYLATAPKPGDLYGEHIRVGERLLAEGRYFDAEERFGIALGMKPGDVTAMVGRLHSELGAGLYLSAAMNLRDLFQQHPEVIGVQFVGSTVPKADRMAKLKADLKVALGKSAANGGLASPEAALLLAYVGFQTGDSAAVVEGLSLVDVEGERLAKAQGKQPPDRDPLVPVLRGVWLGEKLPVVPPEPPKDPSK